MASRINGLGKMLTQSDGCAAAENRVSGGIHALADGGGRGLQTGRHFDPELLVRTMRCGRNSHKGIVRRSLRGRPLKKECLNSVRAGLC